jgi:hypothetical protein
VAGLEEEEEEEGSESVNCPGVLSRFSRRGVKASSKVSACDSKVICSNLFVHFKVIVVTQL